MTHAEGNHGATATDDERDMTRSAQAVGADPGTGQLGARSSGLGAGAKHQGERNGEHDETLQAILQLVR